MSKQQNQKKTWTSPYSLIESGTPELQGKHLVVLEDVAIDLRHSLRRARVSDQSELDKLFLERRITMKQFVAGEEYLAVLSRSGAFPQSSGFEKGPATSGREAEGRIIGRAMLASRPRRLVIKFCGPKALLVLDAAVMSSQRLSSEWVEELRKALDILVPHFRVDAEDPRDL